jgi:ppGpp synthetase/RelA/SpoT-type nucleotidyltranferase
MEWIASKPQFSKTAVDAAGFFLFGRRGEFNLSEQPDEAESAYDIVSNWRSAHNYPLNDVQKDLRKRARKIDPSSIVVQRIKRISSIRAKIVRYPTMRLSMMQDIEGCRAVMNSVQQVRDLVKSRKECGILHKLTAEDDYIASPQRSGYRGVHLVYRYFSDSDKTKDWKGLKVEMQLRTNLQHAWATAVETVGTFTNQALKSSQGKKHGLDSLP